jgi:dipeptidyl aminopeptidase/acylaminoacyl peptidase
MPAQRPLGTWPSPITAGLVAEQSIAYDAVQVAGDEVFWLKQRPSEGRTALVRWTSSGVEAAIPPQFPVGTSVHAYGGGAYLATETSLIVSNADDHRLYQVQPGQRPQAITPASSSTVGMAYADLRIVPGRALLVCVRERRTGREPVDELVAVPIDRGASREASPWVLTSGQDFYAAPRPSPDGRRLAWLSWDASRMPWDGTDLWAGELDGNGRLGSVRQLAGGRSESIVQPEWGPDGSLYFLSDRSGWWNLYRHAHGACEPLAPMAAEFADPPWELDYSTYAFVPGGRIVCRIREAGTDRLAVLDPYTGRLTDLPLAYTSIKPYLRASGNRVVFIGASPVTTSSVMLHDLESGRTTSLASSQPDLDPSDLTTPTAIMVPASDGAVVPAFYYRPHDGSFSAPRSARPPLIVQAHPGPTSAAQARLELRTQFFTSRGFAVVDVNYGGSTGYGRAYRERLTGQWGVVDVQDCTAVALHLISEQLADPQRVVIAGASAGGFTALCALAARDVFAAGVSYSGIADLETFARTVPKFQRPDLRRLIGPLPEAEALYKARSPARQADRIGSPLLVLHGGQDPVVPVQQAEAIVSVLRQLGKPCRYVLFPDEGHGFRRGTNLEHALHAELRFYADTLHLR